jgi:hypothetical protein
VDSNNTQDALVLCSTAAPLCDAGYSGKCIELADDAKQPLLLQPSKSAQVLHVLLQPLKLLVPNSRLLCGHGWLSRRCSSKHYCQASVELTDHQSLLLLLLLLLLQA